MRIIYNRCNSLWRTDRIETSGYRMKRAKSHKHLFFFLTQQNGCPEYCQQIGSIELADKLNCQLVVVEVEQHSFKMRLQYPPFKVTKAS